MGKHQTGYERVDKDLYPTRERWVTEALLAHIDLAGLVVWEPAAGEGDMAKVLKASSAARIYCSDVVDRGYPLDALHDFTSPSSPDPGIRFDAIITNPPFGLRAATAEAFIEAGLRHIAKGGLLALLLPTDFDSAGRRRPLFHGCPWFAARISLTRRIVWFERPDGQREAPKENHCWFVWQRTALRISTAPAMLYGPTTQPLQMPTGRRAEVSQTAIVSPRLPEGPSEKRPPGAPTGELVRPSQLNLWDGSR
jgi:hypothetical protein